MRNLAGNIRYALRQFRQSPVFTTTAVLTLALGIGGTTAIFTLIHAVMLRSLPVTDPASLYRVGDGDDCCVESGPQERWGMYSYSLYQRLKTEMPEFEEVAAFQAGRGLMSVRREGEPVARPMRSEYVTGNYFAMLGVQALGGRMLTPEDDRPGAAPAIVLSHYVWSTTFGGDASVVGATFVMEGRPFTVVGVAPPQFFGETLRSDPPDVWIPVQLEPMIAGQGSHLNQHPAAWLRVMGRVRAGASVSVDALSARLTGVLQQWLQYDSQYPANWMPDVIRTLPKQKLTVVPAGAGVAVMKEDYGRSLQILLAVCGMVLLIACANVANLLLARAAARRGQTAVRMALGAMRRQVIGQALTESVLLAVLGGVAGLAVSMAAARLLLSLTFPGAHFIPISISPSWLVLGFAFVMSLVTGALFGAAPAWFATRTDPAEALRGAGRGTREHGSSARKVLLVVQATLSVVLVAGAAMLARSLNNMQNQNFGYSLDGRVLVGLHNPPSSYTQEKLTAMYRQLEERLSRVPGVEGTGLALYNPLTDNWGEIILVAGHPPPKMDSEEAGSSWDRVSTHYLQNLGVPLVRGRMFDESDNENSEPVALVNERFVKRFFKNGEDPIGQHFGMDLPENAGTFRIIGVVGDAHFAGWALTRPAFAMFYVPLAQNVNYANTLMQGIEAQSHRMGGLLLATKLPPGALEAEVNRALADVDPNLTTTSVRTIRQEMERRFNQERAVASLAGLFGMVALVLAAIGLYGVMAYTVTQKTNEIGIRMALGADRAKVVGMILGGAFQRVAIGLLLGLPLAVGAGRLISAQLYGLAFWDPVALAVAASALAVCAFVAAIIPASRAAGVSPVEALRSE